MWFWYSFFYAILNSISAIFTKKTIGKLFLPTFVVSTNFFLLFSIIIFLVFHGGFPQITPLFIIFIGIAGLLDIFGFFASLTAMKLSEVSLLSPLSAITPLFTLLFAAITLHEIPTPLKGIGVILVVIGIYTLNISEISNGIHMPIKKLFSQKGVWLYIIAQFIWSITPIFQKKAIYETFPQTPIFASFADMLIVTCFFFFFFFQKFSNEIKVVKLHLPLIILLGVSAMLAQLAAYSAFSIAPVGYVVAIMRTSVLFTILIGGLFLKEKNIGGKFIGGIIMIAGVILIAI